MWRSILLSHPPQALAELLKRNNNFIHAPQQIDGLFRFAHAIAVAAIVVTATMATLNLFFMLLLHSVLRQHIVMQGNTVCRK